MTDNARLLARTAEIAADLPRLARRPPGRRARSISTALRAAMGGPLPGRADGPARGRRGPRRRGRPGLVASAGPRYFGFVVGGSLPAALGADWLAAAWDQNAGLYVLSPAAAVAEEVAAAWLVELLGLPAGTSVGFVTGATMANFTALAAARHAVLAQAGWDVERHGLQGAPPVTVVTHAGSARHGLRVAPDARARAGGRARPEGRRRRPGPDAAGRAARGPRRRSTGRRSSAPRPAT